MLRTSARRTSTLAAALLVLAACRGPAPEAGDAAQPESGSGAEVARAIEDMLRSSAASWNAGELDGFLDDYLDSPSTVFIGATRTYGVDEVRRRYEEGYWAGGVPPQELVFDSMAVEPLGERHALAHGRYVLTSRDTRDTVGTGYFTLVLVRTGDGWRIMHDHSSATEPPDPEGG